MSSRADAHAGVILYLASGGRWSDYKTERISALLDWLGRSGRDCDVLCFQECYSSMLFGGNFRDRVISGAKKLGFSHAAFPSSVAKFPAWLSMNSGLVILSKKLIVGAHHEVFALSTESFNVNRAMLCVELSDGTFVVTAHVAPVIFFARRSQQNSEGSSRS